MKSTNKKYILSTFGLRQQSQVRISLLLSEITPKQQQQQKNINANMFPIKLGNIKYKRNIGQRETIKRVNIRLEAPRLKGGSESRFLQVHFLRYKT